MRVLLRGGPLNGEVREAPCDEQGNILEFANFLQPFSSPAFLGAKVSSKSGSVEILRYKLCEIWQGKSLRHYEYHYQGR